MRIDNFNDRIDVHLTDKEMLGLIEQATKVLSDLGKFPVGSIFTAYINTAQYSDKDNIIENKDAVFSITVENTARE